MCCYPTSQFVNYWKGNRAPCPAVDQADSNGEQELMESTLEKSGEVSIKLIKYLAYNHSVMLCG